MMIFNRPLRDVSVADEDTQMQDSTATTTNAPAATPVRKRPKLDFTSLTGGERKRGKSMFGILVNTLNKAKAEDKERNASEAVRDVEF